MIAALLLCAALAQDPPITAEPDRRVEIDLQSYYTQRRLALILSEVATKYPELVRVETLGTTASGAQVPVLTLARLDGDSPLTRPAMLVVGGFGAEDLFSTELALALVKQVLQENRRDATVGALLDGCVLHVVPCLDLDLREQVFAAIAEGKNSIAPRKSELDRNFPADWDPLAHPGAGPYPLSEPEARALAEFLLARPNIALCQRFRAAGPRAGEAATSWPAADRSIERELAAEGLFDGLEALEGAAGSFLRFAYAERGAFVFCAPVAFERGGGWALPPVQELAPLGRAAAQSTLRLARALPRLGLSAPAISLLAPGQWTIDVELSNLGRLPTASAHARATQACAQPVLEVQGAKLVAAALVRGGESKALAPRGSRLELPELEGGARLALRLFVSGDAESELTLQASAPRAGRASASARLR